MYKDPESGQWCGPAEVKLTGRGYMCLLTDRGLRWIPAKWVKPWLRTNAGPGIVPAATGTAPAGAGATDPTDSD